jgi:uncharacterized protein (DUF1697 family)
VRYLLLLRAVNLGPSNKVPMADLRALLEELGHTRVRTYLNSGNATFVSAKRSTRTLATQVENGIQQRLGLSIRACVRTDADIAKALDGLPELTGYVVLNVLFDRPAATVLEVFLQTDWSPEVVRGNDEVLYMGFRDAAKTKLTNGKIERALGISCTARTPATLRKMLEAEGTPVLRFPEA